MDDEEEVGAEAEEEVAGLVSRSNSRTGMPDGVGNGGIGVVPSSTASAICYSTSCQGSFLNAP